MVAIPSAEGNNDAAIERSIDALREHSFARCDALFDATLLQALHEECRQLHGNDALAPAATGRGATLTHEPTRRGDRIRWLDAGASPAQREFFEAMHALRTRLNRRLLLGLDEIEAHFALYPPGAGYARHLDRFRDDDARVASLVTYLTPDWRRDDGGELRLHLPAGALDILPNRGTTVIFLSAEIEHEVLPTLRDRASIAAWFRQRALPARR
jgi:SM-20-related protein